MQLARRMEFVQASEIREILKLTQRPSMISFAGGLPEPELFPVQEMAALSSRLLLAEGASALQYSSTEGDPELRQAIADRCGAKERKIDAQRVLITSGSQQGLDLCGKVFLDESSTVFCESPTYLGAIQAFRAYGPHFVEIDTDDHGMDLEQLSSQLEARRGPALIYVVPDFQNPSGRCWSLSRRRGLLQLAAEYDVPIVEDNPYGELRFAGQPLPTLLNLDSQGLVIQLGTFSKIFCPGLRVAWLIAEPDLLHRFVLVKQGTDLHTSTLGQRQIAHFLQQYDLDAHIQTIRPTYARRCRTMLATMGEFFPTAMDYTKPDGGLFLWVECPPQIDCRSLLEQAIEQGVAFVPGSPFYPGGGHRNTLRLNFSAMPSDKIAVGIRRLGALMEQVLAEKGIKR